MFLRNVSVLLQNALILLQSELGFTTCVDYETRQNAIGFIKIVINKLKKRYLSEVQEKHELLVNTDIANNLSFKVIYKNFGGAVLYKSVLIYI